MPSENSINSGFHVAISPGCNIRCKHCLCTAYKLPTSLAKGDFKYILNALLATKATSIKITGGEPTLNIPLINNLINFIKTKISNVKLGILTNASFAASLAACNKVLGGLNSLSAVCVSYDRFHAEYVPIVNLKTLIVYCKKRKISISGFAAISSPLDLIDVLNYEKKLGIAFHYQNVLPVGDAIKNNVAYTYDYFEPEVLQKKCPQLASLIYIPPYGFTHCCSSLVLQMKKNTLGKVANRDVQLYRQSKFYSLMLSHTMGELAEMAGKKVDDFPPKCSNICELCRSIVPSLLGEKHDRL